MKTKHHHLLTGKLAIALLLTLANLASVSLPVSAQVVSSLTQLQFTPPPLPNRELPKGRSRGGASRGEQCQAATQMLTALVPSQQRDSIETVGGNTISENPTLWFYVPYTLTDEALVEFVLLDEQENKIYQTALKPSRIKAGIVGVSLAKETTTLEKDKLYHWYFLVYCEKDNPVFVDGWIQRVSISPDLERRIQQASPKERIALLAAYGIWYDALAELAKMRSLHPDDATLIDDWESLLESAGVQVLITEPMSILN